MGVVVGAILHFGKTSGQLLGVDIHFRLRLLVSPEHDWSWGTTTIKTHLPTYKESLADLTTQSTLTQLFTLVKLLTFELVIGFHSSSTQVVDSRIPKAQHFSGSLIYKLAYANLAH